MTQKMAVDPRNVRRTLERNRRSGTSDTGAIASSTPTEEPWASPWHPIKTIPGPLRTTQCSGTAASRGYGEEPAHERSPRPPADEAGPDGKHLLRRGQGEPRRSSAPDHPN